MQDFEIKFLADCPQHIPTLAQLWLDEIGKPWIPNASLERAQETYTAHANKADLPITFVGLHGGNPVAMVSLRKDDGLGEQLTPWLGSLIVHPDYRKKGFGNYLIEHVKNHARSLGFNDLFLLALDPHIPNWYGRLNWHTIGVDQLYHHPVTLMKIRLS